MTKSISESDVEIIPVEQKEALKTHLIETRKWKNKIKWFALFLCIMIDLGNYYCYDFPQALQEHIMYDMGVNSFQYSLLYSLYFLPNSIIPLFGGLLVDRFTPRMCCCLFGFILLIGQYFCFVGAFYNIYHFMLAGRLIYGLAGENLDIAISTIISIWFKNKELTLAMGLSTSVALMGSYFNSILTPRFYNIGGDNLLSPLYAGLVFLFISFGFAVFLFFIDRKMEKRDQRSRLKQLSSELGEAKPKLSDIKKLPLSYYLLLSSDLIVSSSFYLFTNIQNDFYMVKYGWTNAQAGLIVSIPYLQVIIGVPFVGWFVDKYGQRTYIFIISSIISIIAFFLWWALPNCYHCWICLIPLIIFGIFYTWYSAVIWPAIPLVVPENLLGTAFGLTTATNDFILFLLPMVIGLICDQAPNLVIGYEHVSLFFIGLATLGLIVHIIIHFHDKELLNKSHNYSDEVILARENANQQDGDDQGAVNENEIPPRKKPS